MRSLSLVVLACRRSLDEQDWSTRNKDEEATTIELNVREWYCARELEPPEGFAKGEQVGAPPTPQA